MIPVKVEHLFVSNMGFVVMLKSQADSRSVPIFIGPAEAQSIALQLNHITPPRPLTHDLMKRLFDGLECRLLRVEIVALQEGTFFARMLCAHDGVEMAVDARPSDAIAMALRCAAPIYVARAVMDEAGREFEFPEDAAGADGASPASPVKHAPPPSGHKLSPLETLKQALERAVAAEQYEEAARLRDQIKQIEEHHAHN